MNDAVDIFPAWSQLPNEVLEIAFGSSYNTKWWVC